MADRFFVTFFPNQSAQTKSVEMLTLEELRDKIQTKTAAEKGKLPWLKLASFGDKRSDKNCIRNNANVLSISGVELDYDQEQVTLDQAIAVVKKAKLRGLLYTSASYTDATPRWRIVLPTSKTLPPSERAKLVARVNGLYGDVFSPESFTLSQAYYFGSVNRNPAHRAVVMQGDYIDLRDDLDATALGKNIKPFRTNKLIKQYGAQRYEKPSVGKVAFALVAAFPDGADVDYPTYIAVGQEIKSWDASDEVGWAMFNDWAQTWPGDYDELWHWAKWRSFRPTQTNIGALFNRATARTPGWRDAYEEVEWKTILMTIRK